MVGAIRVVSTVALELPPGPVALPEMTGGTLRSCGSASLPVPLVKTTPCWANS